MRDYSEEAVKERVEDVLGIVDLAHYADRSPFALSLGERRRLSVATMLVLEPHLLILDEPTIGQDHERAQQLMGLIARLRQRYATTVLMITHDVRLVAEWADRAMVLSRGRLLFDGAPAEMFADEALLAQSGLWPAGVRDQQGDRGRTSLRTGQADTLRLDPGPRHCAIAEGGGVKRSAVFQFRSGELVLPPADPRPSSFGSSAFR